MELHPTQKQVAADDSIYRVVCCGRQWGKTTLAIWEMVACGYAKSGRKIIYYATTIDQARDIVWAKLKKITIPIAVKVNESRLEMLIKTQDGGTSELFLEGFENIETSRGKQFDLIVIDEVAYLRNFEYAWGQILEPTLAFRKGKALFISTPQGFNFFYKLYNLGQESDGQYWKSWRFTSYENPHLPRESIEKAKKGRTQDAFATEYLADFRKFVGLVYKEFQREVHVIESFDVPDAWSIYRGLDFGNTNPTACLWIAVDSDENWYVTSEHYATGKTIDYHAGVINSLKFSSRVSGTYGDPSGAQWISEFAQKGIYITPANKEVGTNFNSWVRFGIEKVSEALKVIPGHTVSQHIQSRPRENGMPRLFVFNTCVNTIREFETYRWKEKSVTQAQDLNEPDVPEKANDHCFTGDTLILTLSKDKQIVGTKPIKFIKKGEYVWSPFGWNEVYRAGSTGIKKVKDYGIFKCTPDHKMLTNRGLVEVDKLGYSDKILVWSNVRSWSLTELFIGGIQTPKIELIDFIFKGLLTKSLMARRDFCTETYGNTAKAKFLMAIWFIILTATLGIMTLVTLSLSLIASMLSVIVGAYGKATKNTSIKSVLLLRFGTLLKRVGLITPEMPNRHGQYISMLPKHVRSAIRGISLPSLIEANIAVTTARQQPSEDAEVYNLATRFGMYFANGVLVSNSMDALRYFAVSYKKPDPVWVPPKDDISRMNWSLD